MAGEIVLVQGDDKPPTSWDAAVLVVGTEAEQPAGTSWPSRAVELLRKCWRADGRLVVFLSGPVPRAKWPARVFSLVDILIVWAPSAPEIARMAADTWFDPGRIVLGIPPGLPDGDELADRATRHSVPVAVSRGAVIAAAIGKIGEGARRDGAERDVPLLVWRTASFQRWYTAQREAGNTLLGARLVWTFRAGGAEPGTVFFWALHVRVLVAAEGRVKDNEVVISRPDVSVVALYRRGSSLDETTVVLVREFRSPASTPDGNVHELPGGSALASASPRAQAADEVSEEIGLTIDVSRFRAHGSRQVAATMSAHHAYLFSAEITEVELERLRRLRGRPHGLLRDSERTWVEITSYRKIRSANLVDWATLGMLSEALSDL